VSGKSLCVKVRNILSKNGHRSLTLSLVRREPQKYNSVVATDPDRMFAQMPPKYFLLCLNRADRSRQNKDMCTLSDKAEHESGLPAAHYRYTRGFSHRYETHESELPVIAGLHGSGCFFWCCEYLPQVLMRLRFFFT
jgi:hypothetical protein